MIYKKIFLQTCLGVAMAYVVHGQEIKLPTIFAGDNIEASFSTNIQAMVQPMQLLPLAPDGYVLTGLTPKLLKPGCIPHGLFAFTKFEAQRHDDGAVKLVFETQNEYTNRTLTIERVFANGTENLEITQPADTSYALFARASKLPAFIPADSQYARNRGYRKAKYEVTDHNAYSGITFYRVTASDYEDTANTVTEIIAVVGKPIKETLGITPNPVESQANLQVYSKYDCKSMVQLINIQGTVVKQFAASLRKGENSLPAQAQGLTAGMYYVRVLRSAHTTLQTNMMKF